MFRFTALIAAILATSLLTTPVLAQDLARYTNARFGVTALVPSTFTMQPPPANGDGAVFVGPGGGTITVYGGYDLFGGLGPAMQFVKDGLAQVTYEAEGPGWQVVSGFAPTGEIVYNRAETGFTCSGELAIGHVELRYPRAARETFDALVKPVADSLGFVPC